ncbi:snRNA-activating protein of 50kDa MW C terminal-domain-containing protein [Trametes punicea]|nr:snRNA-activating protein of 50kDa MW C terminal-domain-containing protein [Trametes punicea]
MNLTPGQAHEAYVGPPSEPVDVSAFLKSASDLQDGSGEHEPVPIFSQSSSQLTEAVRADWSSLPQDEQDNIRAECCVDDLRMSLEETVKNPRLMGHVSRTHEAIVHAIYETAEPSTRKKRKRTTLADPAEETSDVTCLRLKLEATKLKCWPLTMHAASFIRPPRQSDHNTLIRVKKLGTGIAGERDAVIFITVYNRQSWGQRLLSRSSQHVLLSSQTLGDLFRAVPCTSKELPSEIRDEAGRITGYKTDRREDDMAVDRSVDAVMCVEGVLYSGEQAGSDYAEKVLRLCEGLPEGRRVAWTKGPSMDIAKLSSLTVRLHEPYWILHAGNCEHFFVVTAIRLRHPFDPVSGYPLTTQITPPLSDICRACSKVPAVFSVVGDVRLGESPFLICGPCWRWMGEPEDEEVLVVPLPRHEQGWISNVL